VLEYSAGLEGSINVAPEDDFEFYKAEQIKMCGGYAEVDIFAEAHDLPFDDNAQDYVISSHVFEHLPDPYGALLEWVRVVKNGGYIFMIVPIPGAHPSDADRKLATLQNILDAIGVTVDTWDYQKNPVPDGRRGHYFVYSPESLQAIIEAVFHNGELKLVEAERRDTKVGNGFTLVYRVEKIEPEPEPEEEYDVADAFGLDDEPEPDIAFGYDDVEEEAEPAPKKTRKRRNSETSWLSEGFP
jgi:SAM-dependent methyltransferase